MSYSFPPWTPKPIEECYEMQKVRSLFQWQAEILSDEALLPPLNRNLVYSAPTSAGKTLVAELLAIYNLVNTQRRVIFVFPYISTAREKFATLQVFLFVEFY